MNAPSVDIKDILESESALGLTFATNLFIGKEPAEPDNCVTIFDTPGYPPGITLSGKGSAELEKPSIQVRVRNNSYLAAYNLMYDIKEVLHGRVRETWNGTEYCSIKALGEPFLLTWDNEKAVFVLTFDIQRTGG